MSTTYRIFGLSSSAGGDFAFARDCLYDEAAQEALETAKGRGLRVSCQCGEEAGLELSIVGVRPNQYLSRRPQDAARHSADCAHGRRTAREDAGRGYAQGVIVETDDGRLEVDLGDLLLGGPASDELDAAPEHEGSGGPRPEQPLRTTVSTFGLLCLLLERAGLHRLDAATPSTDPWQRLDRAAQDIKPRGHASTDRWGLANHLLVQSDGGDRRKQGNFKRLEATNGLGCILFVFVGVSTKDHPFGEKELDLSQLFGVEVHLSRKVLSSAKRRHRFAAQRLKALAPVLVFGRAHVQIGEPTRRDVEKPRFAAAADHVALIPIAALGLTPIPRESDLKRLEKALQTGEAFEAKLPYDKR